MNYQEPIVLLYLLISDVTFAELDTPTSAVSVADVEPDIPTSAVVFADVEPDIDEPLAR